MLSSSTRSVESKHSRRLFLAIPLSTVLLSWAVTFAVASAVLDFKPSAAEPGFVVTAQSVGSGAFTALRGSSLRLYFLPEGNEPTTASDLPGGGVGMLRVDENGDASATFHVPETGPGHYGVWINCPPCAQFSAGRSILEVGTFEVLVTAAPRTDTAGQGDARPLASLDMRLIGALVGVSLLGFGFVLLRLRQRIQ